MSANHCGKMLFFPWKLIFLVNIFVCGKKTVWRKPNTSLSIKNFKPIVRHGGGHIMIFGCIFFQEVEEMAFIKSNMNPQQYIDIQRDNLCNNSLKLGIPSSFYFQQNNDPKHTAYITRLWLLCNVKKYTRHCNQQTSVRLKIDGIFWIRK